MSVSLLYINLICEANIIEGGISQYVEYTDGTTYIRKGIRDSIFVIDIALTPTAFTGIEGIDWECIKMVT